MAIDGIGAISGAQTSSSTNQNTTINQEDFIRLFLSQLQFQDPLEPVDNREFLAQLAQFTNLEQSRQVSQNTSDLVAMNASTQALSLLNKQVEVLVPNGTTVGTVTTIQFTPSGPQVSVQPASGEVLTGVSLSQIRLVKP
jgi:flagellar basal-body rod modification protein FlgD